MELSIECAFHTCFIFSHTVHSTHELEELGITKHISLDWAQLSYFCPINYGLLFFFFQVSALCWAPEVQTQRRESLCLCP